MNYRRLAWLALVFAVSIIAWRFIWGYCWNPLETTCFVAPIGGDHVQHYYAWIAYAFGGLATWIPPKFSNWTWPLESPLIYGDTVPLASIVFAPLAKIRNYHFHYFSLLSLVSILISGFCGFRIAIHQKLLGYQAALLGVILALSPPAILRLTGHEALSLQAVLVVAITFLILRVRTMGAWLALVVIAAGVHAYFLPMVLILAFFAQVAIPASIESGHPHVNLLRKKLFLNIGLLFAVAFFSMLFYGYIPINSTLNGGETWGANALALLDSQALSLFAKPLDKLEPFQWEGFSYLGWSNLVLIIAAVSLLFLDNGLRRSVRQTIFPRPRAYAFILILFFFYSLGSPWMVAKFVLFKLPDDIPLVSAFMNVFRSTGRYIWPVYYSLVIWGFVSVCKKMNCPKLLFFIIAVLMLESYWPTAYATKGVIKDHYQKGLKWRAMTLSAPSELTRMIQGSAVVLNVTGNQDLEVPALPAFSIQALNPVVVTNYKPYLARLPQAFSELMDQEPCLLAKELLREAQDKFEDDQILLMLPDKDAATCSASLDLVKKYPLDLKQGVSFYGKRSP